MKKVSKFQLPILFYQSLLTIDYFSLVAESIFWLVLSLRFFLEKMVLYLSSRYFFEISESYFSLVVILSLQVLGRLFLEQYLPLGIVASLSCAQARYFLIHYSTQVSLLRFVQFEVYLFQVSLFEFSRLESRPLVFYRKAVLSHFTLDVLRISLLLLVLESE